MYKLVTFEETVRIPPNLFGEKPSAAALSILRETYERTVQKGEGIIISLHNAKIKSPGRVITGDGGAYFDVQFDALTFAPEVNEIVEGPVSEIVEFGAFVRLGPIDGLVHVSQVTNDFMTFDKKTGVLVGKQTKKVVKKGDQVRAKIATISWKDTIPASKIALTMRPEGLGRRGEKEGREEKKK
ncbi:MAG TPA: DNA-directed RNA polymerase [Candidatus Norongarragalinales archaeon]|nr:DNA-directed RNA polymerase [Candidatus Norongarragalinales archaeon]